MTVVHFPDKSQRESPKPDLTLVYLLVACLVFWVLAVIGARVALGWAAQLIIGVWGDF